VQLIERLGLTPRREDAGGRIAQYMQGKALPYKPPLSLTRSVAFAAERGLSSGGREEGAGRSKSATAARQAFAWLPSSAAPDPRHALRTTTTTTTPAAASSSSQLPASGSLTARGRVERSTH
jgi:hypothetical protein